MNLDTDSALNNKRLSEAIKQREARAARSAKNPGPWLEPRLAEAAMKRPASAGTLTARRLTAPGLGDPSGSTGNARRRASPGDSNR